jgi:TatD DNase family protein
MLVMNTLLAATLFDTHCHFDFDVFDSERTIIWQQCLQQGIGHLLIPGVEPSQWLKAHELAVQYSGVFMAAGLHPWWLDSAVLPDKNVWAERLSQEHCVAIGECGLDACIETPLAKQTPIFEQHLQMATECAMPIIIHVRKTHNETIRLLKRYRPSQGGVIHGFTGSIELAQEYWAMGFRLGIGGSITYQRANKTREAVKQMPLESLVLETDAPDMPLDGFQGQANSPLKVRNVAESLAGLRQESLEHIAEVTTHTAKQLFSLS